MSDHEGLGRPDTNDPVTIESATDSNGRPASSPDIELLTCEEADLSHLHTPPESPTGLFRKLCVEEVSDDGDDPNEINVNIDRSVVPTRSDEKEIGSVVSVYDKGQQDHGLSQWDKSRNTVISQQEQSVAEIVDACQKRQVTLSSEVSEDVEKLRGEASGAGRKPVTGAAEALEEKLTVLNERLDQEKRQLCEKVNSSASRQLEEIARAERECEEARGRGELGPTSDSLHLPCHVLITASGEEADEGGPLIGSLFTWPPKVVHKILAVMPAGVGKSVIASDCHYFDDVKPGYFLECFLEHGLYLTDENSMERKQVGEMRAFHWHGCVTPDRKWAFFTTEKQRSVLKYSLGTPREPKLVDELHIQGSFEARGISYSPEFGRLAIADVKRGVVFVIQTDGTPIYIVEHPSQKGEKMFRAPMDVTWSPDGKGVIVADVKGSLVRLSEPPTQALWRFAVDRPQRVWLFGDMLYMVDSPRSKRVHVVSVKDGVRHGVFACPGMAPAASMDRSGRIVVISYESHAGAILKIN